MTNDPKRQADIERRLGNMARAPRCGARTRAGNPVGRPRSGAGPGVGCMAVQRAQVVHSATATATSSTGSGHGRA